MKPCSECGTPTDRAVSYDPDIEDIPLCESSECRTHHFMRVNMPDLYARLRKRRT